MTHAMTALINSALFPRVAPSRLTPANENLPLCACGLVALIGDAPHAWTMVNALKQRFGEFPVVVERGEPASVFWARRREKLGAAAVYSMKAAQLAARLTKPLSSARLAELQAACDERPALGPTRLDVDSLNDRAAITRLQTLQPRAAFVASTGMLHQPVLEALACPAVKYNSGINGGYFALANGELQNFEVTLNLVDRNVDTILTLAKNRIAVTKADNRHTYMTLMAARSQRFVVETMQRVLAGDLTPDPNELSPAQY